MRTHFIGKKNNKIVKKGAGVIPQKVLM